MMEWKTDLQTEWLNFIEKLYSTTVDLFCRYKSDSTCNTHIVYINHLQQYHRSLVSQNTTQYYYALCLKSVPLYVLVIESGIAGNRLQHG